LHETTVPRLLTSATDEFFPNLSGTFGNRRAEKRLGLPGAACATNAACVLAGTLIDVTYGRGFLAGWFTRLDLDRLRNGP
jgi:hypothetical protein